MNTLVRRAFEETGGVKPLLPSVNIKKEILSIGFKGHRPSTQEKPPHGWRVWEDLRLWHFYPQGIA